MFATTLVIICLYCLVMRMSSQHFVNYFKVKMSNTIAVYWYSVGVYDKKSVIRVGLTNVNNVT